MPENTSSRGRRFFALPSTSFGRISTILLLVSVALVVVNVIFFNAPNETGPAWLEGVVGVAIMVSLLAGPVSGSVALTGGHERSWAVWLSTILPGMVVLFEVVDILVPGN